MAAPSLSKVPNETATNASPISPWDVDGFDASKPFVFGGGAGGEEIDLPQGDRVNPCTQLAANCYDRPPGTFPYPTFIVGQFNTQTFIIGDEFVPAANGTVDRICWLGQYSNPVTCPVPAFPNARSYGLFTVTYKLDDGAGFPGIVHAGPFADQVGGGGTLDVAQGDTGNPIGFNNPNAVETGFQGSHAAVGVTAGTCYWVEFNWASVPGGPCFMIMSLSYENVEGNRRLVRRDLSTGQAYQARDRTNLDTTMCIGNAAGTLVLANSNGPSGCTNRVAPGNDEPQNATSIPCGSSIPTFDNTFATMNLVEIYAPFACKKQTTDPTNFEAADVWFKFTPTATTALVSLCATATLAGQVAGDSLMQIYRQTVVGPDFSAANMVVVAGTCSDDSCSGGLSEVCASGLSLTTEYYVRVASFTPVGQGAYTISVDCPCPIAANDLCANAILIPRVGSPGWGDISGVLSLGSTAQATVDGDIGFYCPGLFPSSKGVWYKIVGVGTQVRIDTNQQITGTAIDSRLNVYCSTDDTCNNLTCLAGNDDIDGASGNFNSRVDFCAANGKTYYILVYAFGSGAGSFGMLTVEIRDGSNMVIPCCDVFTCDTLCPYEVPQNALSETNIYAGGGPAYFDVEPCDNLAGGANGNNGGCNNPAGANRKYTPMAIGQTVFGSSRASNGSRDNDWYVMSGMPVNQRFLVDLSFSAQASQRLFPAAANFNYSLCQTITFVVNNTTSCGQRIDRKDFYTTVNQIPLAGGVAGTGDEYLWQIRNNSTTDGYPCGVNDGYWFRVNYVMGMAQCTQVPDPAGTVGVNFTDERDPSSVTFGGFGGFSGFTYEPCVFTPVGAAPPEHRGKGGCNIAVASRTDSDFIKMFPGLPMIGSFDGVTGSAGASRDVDWYMFELLQRSVVTWNVKSGGPVSFSIQQNVCSAGSVIAEPYSTVATLGHCGARCLEADDTLVLDAGIYIVVGVHTDAFGGGTIFATVDCTPAGPDIGVAKYIITLNAVPVPACSVTCPGGSTTETETCPTVFNPLSDSCVLTNDGCSSPGGTFATSAMTVGTPVCGVLFSQYNADVNVSAFSVDTDYWQFTVGSRSLVTYTATADGPVLAQIGATGAAGVGCDADLPNPFTNQGGGLRVLSSNNADTCLVGSPTQRRIYLEPGTYSLILTPGTVDQGIYFADLRCAPVRQLSYTALLTLTPVGSCVVGSDCLIATASECSGLSGVFTADGGASCNAGYSTAGFNTGCSAYSTISGSGSAVALCGDSELAQRAIPPFSYYGVSYTQVNISTNGYISFGSTPSSDTPRAFANNGTPNAVIGAFWNDWKVACQNAVGVSGSPSSVWIQTTGVLGNEVTIIEWKDLRKFVAFNQSASFQIVLTHSNSMIEFRYGGFTGLNKKDLDRMAVGLEDGCGLRGVNVALSGAFLNGNSCIKFNKLSVVPPCCPGNANKVAPGAVNFDDITAVLGNWNANYGAGTGPGDANCDGIVNFDDITSVLSNWLNACP